MRFWVTPTMLDEQRKHFIIRHLIGEVDWSSVDVLVVDMPPGTGEEVRGLLKLGPSIAVVVTAQLIPEGAVRKVVEMASEYRLLFFSWCLLKTNKTALPERPATGWRRITGFRS